jgi:Uma2 family endonuclease
MTAVVKELEYISPEEYLEGELYSDVRHEYIKGLVYAMAGSSEDHNRIAGNIFGFLHSALRGQRCEPFVTDMKVRMAPSPAEVFYYPDVVVACDPTDNAKYYRERPTLVVEVLSESTRLTDEREKTWAYHQVTSLEAYVMVEQEQPIVTLLHRQELAWRREILTGADAVLKLECLGVEIPFSAIYERTSVLGKRSPPP